MRAMQPGEGAGGGESQAPSLLGRLVQTSETLHALYLTTLSVCTFRIKEKKDTSVGRRVRKKKKRYSVLPSTAPDLHILNHAAERMQ